MSAPGGRGRARPLNERRCVFNRQWRPGTRKSPLQRVPLPRREAPVSSRLESGRAVHAGCAGRFIPRGGPRRQGSLDPYEVDHPSPRSPAPRTSPGRPPVRTRGRSRRRSRTGVREGSGQPCRGPRPHPADAIRAATPAAGPSNRPSPGTVPGVRRTSAPCARARPNPTATTRPRPAPRQATALRGKEVQVMIASSKGPGGGSRPCDRPFRPVRRGGGARRATARAVARSVTLTLPRSDSDVTGP